jgi:hypothetical protein
MLGLRKFLQREPDDNPVTEVEPSGHSADEIAQEYRSIISDQLVRGGVLAKCVEIDVRQGGKMRDSHPLFLAMLRLTTWERTSAIRLLLGLPILESRLRRAIRGSWLREVSHFGGIWVHASGQLQDGHAMEDLRSLIVEVEHRDRDRDSSQPPSTSGDASVWSLPTDLGQLPHK